MAETVWASTCAPATVRAVVGGVSDVNPDPDGMSGMMQGPGGENHEHDQRRCPFGPMAMAQGCFAVASLPTRAAEAPVLWALAIASHFGERAQQDLLSATALFHPPRA